MSRRNLSPRSMKRLMKNLKVEEIDAEEVIIRTKDEEIVITNPNVSLTNMQGVDVYQIVGNTTRRSRGSSTSSLPPFDASSLKEKDIQLVAKNAGVSEDVAKDALIRTRGDLAAAIMYLRSKKK